MSGTATAPGTLGAGSFQKRRIDVTITLGKGAFGTSGQNTVKLTGLRAVASIEKMGFPSMDKAFVRVYGVRPAVMNAVSTLGIPLAMWRPGNTMLVEAGDDANGMAIVYNGYLHQAYQNFDEAPDTSLVLAGWGGQDQAILPAKPISFQGTADVATMMAGIASTMGYAFENNGVNVKLSNQYCCGTPLEQSHAIARAANIEVYVDTGKSPPVLAIWPKYGTRGGMVPLISARSGLVGYPKFQSNGMSFRCIFNPSLKLGGQIEMQSTTGGPPRTVTSQDATAAAVPSGTQSDGPNGIWTVISPFTYDLASEMPGGPWFCEVHCARVNGPGAPR